MYLIITYCSAHNDIVTGPLYVIMEYASHGNLRNFLRDRRPSDISVVSSGWFDATINTCGSGSTLTYADLVSFAEQVASGLLYLTSKMVEL